MKHHLQLKIIFSAPRGAVALVHAWIFIVLPQTRYHSKSLLHKIVHQSQRASSTTHPLTQKTFYFNCSPLLTKSFCKVRHFPDCSKPCHVSYYYTTNVCYCLSYVLLPMVVYHANNFQSYLSSFLILCVLKTCTTTCHASYCCAMKMYHDLSCTCLTCPPPRGNLRNSLLLIHSLSNHVLYKETPVNQVLYKCTFRHSYN